MRARFAERHLVTALADYGAGRLARRDLRFGAGRLVALAILASPLPFIGGGVALAVAGWPSWLTLVIGGILVAAGLWLLPRRSRMPKDALGRADMPATFALLDAISSAMDGPRVSRIVVEPDLNAFVLQVRGDVLLGMGDLLWVAATREERLAILAHEIGHLVNGDPLRMGVTGRAHGVLDGWHRLLAPSGYEEVASEIVQLPLTLAVELADRLLIRLTYPESQRAEYLADALAAEVAGAQAMSSALRLLTLAPLADARLNRFHGPSTPGGVALLEDVGRAMQSGDADLRARTEAAALADLTAIDRSHPPTALRLRFLGGIEARRRPLATPDWTAIEAEWTAPLAALGDRRRRDALVQ